MNQAASDQSALLARATAARQAGRLDEAIDLLSTYVRQDSGVPAAWNLLGIAQLEAGDPEQAAASFRAAIAIDPAPPLWLNLAKAWRALGRIDAELQALDSALAIEAYYLPAIFAKGQALRLAGREPEAAQLYRLLLDGIESSDAQLPPQLTEQLEEAKAFLAAVGEQMFRRFQPLLAELSQRFPDADLSRATAFAEVVAGKRKVFVQRPTDAFFPYLPAIEYFSRDLFPWFEQLERSTADMREELLSLWREEDAEFRPYVNYAPGTPLNQWAELNRSTRWSAWFFWEDGRRNEAACRRCPKTAAALEQLPLLDVPGKSPTAMFSVLQPRTRIPPHTGTSNTRVTVHLPLVVPPGCGFRVGATTREWEEGVAWAFDDTIEHEAWNNSDQPRAILIVDAWNPLLTAAEREAVRQLG